MLAVAHIILAIALLKNLHSLIKNHPIKITSNLSTAGVQRLFVHSHRPPTVSRCET